MTPVGRGAAQCDSDAMPGPHVVFDRAAVRANRARAARDFGAHDFLFAEVADRLIERLGDVDRRFARALVVGGRPADAASRVLARAGTETAVVCDLAPDMSGRAGAAVVTGDEEALPFAAGAFDLIVSVLGLHWVNDVPGALAQIRRALRPDGLFLAALLGGDTLMELRRALIEAEAATTGGASPRVSPFVAVREAGALLQRAGFALPVADTDTITVTWADPLSLMRELRGMGEANALVERRRGFTRRDTLLAAARRYGALFADADGRIPATFQVIYLTAWAPHESQQKPLVPGSAEVRLADALGTRERKADC